jgi:hypothetical protein
MGLAMRKEQSPLRLHIRCENCLRESSQVLAAPSGYDLPDDPYDLEEGGYLNNQPFFCTYCESSIGKLFAISGGKVE